MWVGRWPDPVTPQSIETSRDAFYMILSQRGHCQWLFVRKDARCPERKSYDGDFNEIYFFDTSKTIPPEMMRVEDYHHFWWRI